MDSRDIEKLTKLTQAQGIFLMAQIEMQSMIAENQYRVSCGNSISYGEDAFLNLIEKYGIHHNGILHDILL